MSPTRYAAQGVEAEFEPGSRGKVLRNKLGIQRIRDMQQAESEALEAVQEWALSQFDTRHGFTAEDVAKLHRQWLGGIYAWAGEYRQVNVSKGGFLFAHAPLVPGLMREFERKHLARHTPCEGMDDARLVQALAITHAELILIHPFREGNGRCARLLAWLMALQAGLPPLDFSPLARRNKEKYIAAIHTALGNDYAPLEASFKAVVRRTRRVCSAL
jgi:cell filamentation protein